MNTHLDVNGVTLSLRQSDEPVEDFLWERENKEPRGEHGAGDLTSSLRWTETNFSS